MEVDDGSVREVSIKLVEIYYDCSEGDYDSVKELQEKEREPRAAVGRSRKAPGNDDDDDDDDDDGDDDVIIEEDDVTTRRDSVTGVASGRASGSFQNGDGTDSMDVDGSKNQIRQKKPNSVKESKSTLTREEEEEGWEMAPPKGKKGSRRNL